MNDATTIKAFKGFNKDMTCRGFQFEEGKEYEEDDAIVCTKGFHACEAPLDVFGYYPPGTSRYHEVEQSGKIQKHDEDSKVASSKIKIGAEIGVPGLVKAHVEWVKAHTTTEHTDPKRATAGEYGAATAGKCGAATAGEYGAATAGEYGAATAGKCGAATAKGSAAVGAQGLAVVRGNGVKAKGGLGAVLVLCEEEDYNNDIKKVKAVVVDGEKVKADTWYTLKGGRLKEVKDE